MITAQEIVERALAHALENETPLNSLEGFVRQIVGWREFIRGIHQHYSSQQESSNYFGHERRLTKHWYDGTTGLVPLDDVIKKAQRLGWAHPAHNTTLPGFNLKVVLPASPQHSPGP